VNAGGQLATPQLSMTPPITMVPLPVVQPVTQFLPSTAIMGTHPTSQPHLITNPYLRISALWRNNPDEGRISMANENEMTKYNPTVANVRSYSMSSTSGTGGMTPPPPSPAGAGGGNEGIGGRRNQRFSSGNRLEFSGISANKTITAYISSDYPDVFKEIFGSKHYDTIVIIYDKSVQTAARVIDAVQRAHKGGAIEIPVNAGESLKTLSKFYETMQHISGQHINPTSLMVVIGGGTVCNFGGFIASIWNGMDLLFVPTTYTAISDVAVGSLHMLNVGDQKNLIRTYFDPIAVIIDRHFIDTLPLLERRNGIVETVKHAVTQDVELFERLQDAVNNNSAFVNDVLFDLAIRTAQLKSELLAHNPLGDMAQGIMNFGHIIAHAIEEISGYKIPHGEAVSTGILVELAVFNDVDSEIFRRTHALLMRLGLPTSLPPAMSAEDIGAYVYTKKVDMFPYVASIGSIGSEDGRYYVSVNINDIRTALEKVGQNAGVNK
jgi:3-dehydroquinate synthase